MPRFYRPPSLSGTIRAMRTQQKVQGSASVLARSGLSVPAEGVTAVDGDLQADAFVAGSVGWRLQADGNAEFNDLTLRGGIIGNDALSNPVIPQSVWKGTTANFGLTVAWSTLVTQVLTVPSGVTSVQVIGFVRLVASNTTAAKDYLYSDFAIGDQSCGGFSTPVAAGDAGTSFCSFARTMTGLTAGSTITLAALGSTGVAAWASTNNVCQISASVTWYR